MKRPHILITNDDGIHAPGIRHLWNAVKEIADVTVVAPASEQSAVSLSITVRHPLRIQPLEWPSAQAKVWAVNGTPSDCVKLALHAVLPQPPDLILSGINRGSNAGRNVLYSGTVAAVIEGILHRIPGIAFSLSEYHNPNFSLLEKYIPPLVQYALSHPFPRGTFLNVNFPSTTLGEIKGIQMTRQGKAYLAENPEKRHDPSEGLPYYWLGAKMAHFDEEEDCDITWLSKGYATAVPIHIEELTDLAHMHNQKQNFERFILSNQ